MQIPPLPPSLLQQMDAPPWAWFCRRFLPVRREFSLPSVTKCLPIGSCLIVGVFSVFIVKFLSYNIKHLEVTVVIWCYISQIELNWIKRDSLPLETHVRNHNHCRYCCTVDLKCSRIFSFSSPPTHLGRWLPLPWASLGIFPVKREVLPPDHRQALPYRGLLGCFGSSTNTV